MNPNYEILEQILRLDIEAGATTAKQRAAQKQLVELAKKTKDSEDLIGKTRTDMAFREGEMRRQYKKVDELEARKTERSAKLFAAKTDDEHRGLKREVDNLDREIRDISKRCEELESGIEDLKRVLARAESDLSTSLSATADERKKAEEAENESKGRLSEITSVRETYIGRLEERVAQHYRRVSERTKNPNGPIARVVDGACTNCRIGISPQIMNNILRGKEIESCPTCQHLLLPERT